MGADDKSRELVGTSVGLVVGVTLGLVLRMLLELKVSLVSEGDADGSLTAENGALEYRGDCVDGTRATFSLGCWDSPTIDG